MRVFANTLRQTLPTYNVIAEKKGKNQNNVVMAGAHLDSVLAGPGINDNGSGSAAILEVAEQLANHKPQNTLRFAWWGAEESGLVGSTNYVNGLPQAEKDRIALYLNFDMIGSPNYIFMTQDADQSSFVAPVAVPAGSVQIEDLFESFYTLKHEPYDDAAFDGRSDYQAFILNDIPAGGLFTGAEVPKTAEQQSIWGGTVGAQFDPCYHAGLRHVRKQLEPRAQGQCRPDRVRDAHVRVLDRDRERCAGQEGPRSLPHSGSGRLAGHLRSVNRFAGGRGRPNRPPPHCAAAVLFPPWLRGIAASTVRKLAGGCECGAVRYEVADEFLYAANCHCSRCRAATGSAFKPFAGIERAKLRVSVGEGKLLVYGEEDENNTRCAVCGSLALLGRA